MFLGIKAIAKALLVLAVSFFVLLGVTKTESRRLQQFGRIIAIGLFLVAILSIVCTLYLGIIYGGSPKYMPFKKMHYKMMMPGR